MQNLQFNSLWPSDYMPTWIVVNIDLSDGFLPDSTKPLPEPMLTHRWLGSVALTLPEGNFTPNLEIIFLKSLHLSEANKLTWHNIAAMNAAQQLKI